MERSLITKFKDISDLNEKFETTFQRVLKHNVSVWPTYSPSFTWASHALILNTISTICDWYLNISSNKFDLDWRIQNRQWIRNLVLKRHHGTVIKWYNSCRHQAPIICSVTVNEVIDFTLFPRTRPHGTTLSKWARSLVISRKSRINRGNINIQQVAICEIVCFVVVNQIKCKTVFTFLSPFCFYFSSSLLK